MADKSKHWVDSNNPLAKIIILSRYCVVFLTLPCHSNTGNSCQRVVWDVWAIKIRTTSFWRPCCSKTRRKDDFPSRKVGPSESHLNAAFFLFHRTSAERAPNPDWPARVRRLLTLSQSRLQHWPVPVHPPHVPAGQPAQPTDPLARSSCWYLKKKKKKRNPVDLRIPVRSRTDSRSGSSSCSECFIGHEGGKVQRWIRWWLRSIRARARRGFWWVTWWSRLKRWGSFHFFLHNS